MQGWLWWAHTALQRFYHQPERRARYWPCGVGTDSSEAEGFPTKGGRSGGFALGAAEYRTGATARDAAARCRRQ